jgi:hypothetical protein
MPQGDAIAQTAASMGFPEGTLLPPPSGTQPQGAMPTQGVLSAPVFSDTAMPSGGGQIGVPQMGGPKTQQALAEAAGKAEIERQAQSQQSQNERSRELPKYLDTASSAIKAIDTILADPNRGALSGGPFGLEGRIAAVAPITESQRRLQPYVNQLKGQTFLEAFQALKGGGQITQIEGQKAETAIARLNDQYTPDPEYAQALLDLREVIQNGIARAQSGVSMSAQEIGAQATQRAQELATRPAPISSTVNKVLNYNPQTGRFE